MREVKKLIIFALFISFLLNSFLLFYPFDIAGNIVYISPGTSSLQIATILKKKGIIKSKILFQFAGQILKIFSSFKAGEYKFGTKTSTWEAIQKLIKGEVEIHKVTIPEGYTVEEIALLLSMEKLVDFYKFLSIARKSNFKIGPYHFPENLEGYLFPDTYFFLKLPDGEEEIIREMLSRFKKKVIDVYINKNAIANNMEALHKIIIMASLVEKEAVVNSERPIIARVFYNRLKKGMPLQCDPTIRYALGKYEGKLSIEDTKIKSLFNTYIHTGLPPHPICNPGIMSIEAALHPADVNYLYFVSKNDGTHYFSRDYKSHRKAQMKYQRS